MPPGLELIKADDFAEWQMDIRVLDDNPLYKDQVYRLRFRFGDNYPIRTFLLFIYYLAAGALPYTYL
jgi:ubiquitin-protein ligase